jgi:hypothetical protein
MSSKIDQRVSGPLLSGVVLLIIVALVGIKYERRVAATYQSVVVEIEVLPGEASKFIDTSARSRVPVAILGSADFDSTRVNPASV